MKPLPDSAARGALQLLCAICIGAGFASAACDRIARFGNGTLEPDAATQPDGDFADVDADLAVDVRDGSADGGLDVATPLDIPTPFDRVFLDIAPSCSTKENALALGSHPIVGLALDAARSRAYAIGQLPAETVITVADTCPDQMVRIGTPLQHTLTTSSKLVGADATVWVNPTQPGDRQLCISVGGSHTQAPFARLTISCYPLSVDGSIGTSPATKFTSASVARTRIIAHDDFVVAVGYDDQTSEHTIAAYNLVTSGFSSQVVSSSSGRVGGLARDGADVLVGFGARDGSEVALHRLSPGCLSALNSCKLTTKSTPIGATLYVSAFVRHLNRVVWLGTLAGGETALVFTAALSTSATGPYTFGLKAYVSRARVIGPNVHFVGQEKSTGNPGAVRLKATLLGAEHVQWWSTVVGPLEGLQALDNGSVLYGGYAAGTGNPAGLVRCSPSGCTNAQPPGP